MKSMVTRTRACFKTMRRSLFWLGASLIQLTLMGLIYYLYYFYRLDAGVHWGVADDIYISACYARNLAQGQGLVWFPGADRVEGFSNPLWMLLLALYHVLPGFQERLLGSFVQFGNFIVIFATWWIVGRIVFVQRTPSTADESHDFPGAPVALALLMVAMLTSLAWWQASGFEVGLIGLLAIAAYYLAGSTAQGKATLALIGLLIGLAGWTRLDGVLYMLPAIVRLAWPMRRRPGLTAALLLPGTISCGMLLVMFVARRLYYDEWLPNTYYLKLAGWPLGDRLAMGWRQNWPLLPAMALLWTPLLSPPLRRGLGRDLHAVVGCFLLFTAAVVYSTQNGGDSWGLKFGYDRFTILGALFALIGALTTASRAPARWNAALAAWFVVAIGSPMLIAPATYEFLIRLADPASPRHEANWIQVGREFEEISLPGARIALKPAGAIIYFSHRGGVDLLGKCDPHVARMEIADRVSPPGHNKYDAEDSFKRHMPEFSRLAPPDEFESAYRAVRYRDSFYWIRRATNLAHWDRIIPVSFHASVSTHTLPVAAVVGSKIQFEITCLNDGDLPWSQSAGHSLAILRDRSDMWNEPDNRIFLPPGRIVRPGETHQFRGRLDIPRLAGRHRIDFRMIEENVRQFGERLIWEIEVDYPGRSTAAAQPQVP